MANEQQKLYLATNRLAKYFGLYTARDLAGRIALEQVQGIVGANSTVASFDLPPPPQEITDLVAALIDTSEGSYLLTDLVDHINSLMSNAQEDQGGVSAGGSLQDRVNRFIQIFGPEGKTLTGAQNPVSMSDVLLNSFINSNPNNPDKNESPHLSVIKVNNVRVTPTGRNINAISIFLNGIPTLELSKAVPFLNIQLLTPGSPVSNDGRLQNVSLFRFLEGNVEIDRSAFNARTVLALANKVSNTDFLGGAEATENNTAYTSTGMEIFTAPQVLVNGDEDFNSSTRVNPILDKFQPLLSLKELEVEIAPSTGLMSFKTARLKFTLHDRSRLAEIASLIRPDLYSKTELLIEYGWNHPESDSTSEAVTNHYAELINAMRCKEKFGVVNSSLSFQEGGLVDITLELAMRGGSDASSEVISVDESGNVNQILERIRELSEAIGAYRRRLFGTNAGASSVEIRGVQILDAAEDARNNIILNDELRNNLRDFQSFLRRRTRDGDGAGPANQLATALTELYQSGNDPSTSSGRSSGGLVGALERSVREAIRAKLIRLSTTEDPFLQEVRTGARLAGRRNAEGRADTRTQSGIEAELRGVSPNVSLAKLITFFVGEPLAMTRKFDDVQIVFYPFNNGAGFARVLNIGSFAVDTRFFYENYVRLRLESLSRSGNMNLQDFLQFIASTVLDDMAAPSYGLFDSARTGTPLFRRVSVDGGGVTTEATVDAVEMQTRLERILRGVTPDASFRMPQVDFYLECTPQRVAREGEMVSTGDQKSILKIHVFDRQMTAYETQGSLLAAAREDEIRNISGVPFVPGGDEGVLESHSEAAQTIISAATNANIIERIQNSDMYRISGGTSVLKEFLRRTMPYVIFGAQGTTIRQANLTSIQDPALSTVNMLRSQQTTQLEPNGEQPGGLPLQIIPCELSLSTFGCPLIDFAQQFFIDFQTGTSVDNIYGVVGITHRISPGDFLTEARLAPLDAYGTYRSLLERVNNAALVLREQNTGATSTDQATGNSV
jgi:hypothetical protein